ncbi:MAG: hypothetical protein ACFFDT_28050 [Candidatus Hodarchaeota archaeon]
MRVTTSAKFVEKQSVIPDKGVPSAISVTPSLASPVLVYLLLNGLRKSENNKVGNTGTP